jgi:lantibiotic modifying enzyme
VENKEEVCTLLKNINTVLQSKTADRDGFLGGRLGTIFYYFYYAHVLEDADIDSLARELLADYIEKLDNDELNLNSFSYCNGLAGFAYAISHLYNTDMINIDIEEEFEALDEMLFNSAVMLIKNDYNDFLHGAFGIIHYFNSRQRSEKIDHYLDELIKIIDAHLINLDNTSCIANLSLPSNQVKEKINLSLSHGLNGFVIILLNMLETSAQKETILRIVERCTLFISNNYAAEADEKRFSKFSCGMDLNDGEKEFNNRLGWCYGDLGQLLMFSKIDKTQVATKIPVLPDSIAGDTVSRTSYQSTLVKDSHFCHGASGLAHFYHALYHESGRVEYAAAYDYWISQTVSLLKEDLKNDTFKGNEHSILDGYPGVGLTLLSYIADGNLAWSDAVLLA